jgi:hypothetical protein
MSVGGDDSLTQKKRALMSNLPDGNGLSSSSLAKPKGKREQRDARNSQSSTPSPRHKQMMVAGLHRDGEQARIVEAIRRRQMEQQHQHDEQSTLEYVWENVLYYIGFADDSAYDHPGSSTSQTNGTQSVRRQQIENKKSGNKILGQNAMSSTTKSVMDEAVLLEKTFAERFAKRPYIVRVAVVIIRRIHLILRWLVDMFITRTARLEPLSRSPSMYATSPTYSLQLQADDIICFVFFLWVSLWISSRTIHLFALTVMTMCLVVGSVGRKVLGRVGVESATCALNNSASNARTSPAPVASRKIASDHKGESSKAIKRLQQCHPNATKAECVRFLRCTKSDEKAAASRLDEWLAWRLDNGLKLSIDDVEEEAIPYGDEFIKADEKLWNEAAKLAMEIFTKSSGDKTCTDKSVQLPQIIFAFSVDTTTNNKDDGEGSLPSYPRCKDGSRMFYLCPARFDVSLAPGEVYALAAGLYLDRRLSRLTTEKVSLICELRGGRGWANPTPWSMLPFIRATSSLLGKHFPERLKRMVLVPMPSSALWVWAAVQKFLDIDTASKVVVVGIDGAASNDVDCLAKELDDYITKKDFLLLEERRRSSFTPKEDS